MGRLLGRLGRLARRPRWTAALLLWVYACASLTGGLHVALEAHTVCGHGELTHADSACVTEDTVAAAERSVPLHASEAPEGERGDVHDHCEWVGRACQESAAEDAHRARAPTRAAVPVAVPRERRARTSVPLLALAPHHGPPSRV